MRRSLPAGKSSFRGCEVRPWLGREGPCGGEEGEDVGFGKVETEGFEGNFEFVVVDSLVFVEVEEPELYTGTD